MWVVETDLTEPRVSVESLHADQPFPEESARWPRSAVSHMLTVAGGIAGINASLFEINATMNPRGMRIQAGKPLKSGNPGWPAGIGFTNHNVPYFGYWQWHGGIRRIDRVGYRTIQTLSTSGTGADQLGLFGWPWTQSPGYSPASDGLSRVVELVLTGLVDNEGVEQGTLPSDLPPTARSVVARVEEIRQQQPGVAIQKGMMVLTGYGDAAQYLLDTYRTGDQVELLYAVTGDTFGPGHLD
jgi:hypothetical protein